MSTRLRDRVVRRPSLPLTERDQRDLDLLRESPSYQRALEALSGGELAVTEISEAALLHAVFEAGLAAVRHAAEHEGYALIAAEQGGAEADERRAQARRRKPSWADES